MIPRIFTILLVCGLLICVSGCNRHPEGMKEYRRLTEEEKDRMVEIALDTPEAKTALDTFNTYSVTFGWGYVQWLKHKGEDRVTPPNVIIDEGQEENPVPESEREGELFSEVMLYFGDPSKEMVSVAINPDTEEVARVFVMGLKPH
jgi:hypothetical protein